MTDKYLVTGEAIKEMLKEIDVDQQLEHLKKEVQTVKSISKRDAMIKQIKYLAGVKKMSVPAHEAFVLNHIPVLPPLSRPSIKQTGNKIEHADVTYLYGDHMGVIQTLDGNKKEGLPDSDPIVQEVRKNVYNGTKAVMGLGEALSGASRGKKLKGLLHQIGGEGGPKLGFFQSKVLAKKQDFSARATIYAEPNLGFNEIAMPEDMVWTLYKFHIIRDLVKSGYTYFEAKKAVEEQTQAAKSSMAKLVKQIPVIANRAPTLMQSNITAHFPVPIKGKTLGINPLHLPLYAGDFDGDAMTIHLPITPEAIEEAKKKLLPDSHIYDFRRGLNQSMIAPGHEAIIGSMYLTEPDKDQKVHEFHSEQEVLKALEAGHIKENTPIRIIGAS